MAPSTSSTRCWGWRAACQPSRQGDDWLRQVQGQLFQLGADLATPLDAKADWLSRVDAGHVSWLEATIDQMTAELEPLKHFILPGGAPAAAQLHVARTVCRRAERLIVALAAAHDIGEPVIAYVNRLSDWLFTLSRWENAKAGVSEEKWRPRG